VKRKTSVESKEYLQGIERIIPTVCMVEIFTTRLDGGLVLNVKDFDPWVVQ